MGVSTSLGCTDATSVKALKPPPAWVYNVQLPHNAPPNAFTATSPGMQQPILPNQVVRARRTAHDTDAARWQTGYSGGKHVFQVTFPAAHRGVHSSVGVGLEDAELHQKGRVGLVGGNHKSWGVNLSSRRSIHKGVMTGKFPTTQHALPDTFLMYLDLDSGTMSFGSDGVYFGAAHEMLPRGVPLFPMVSATVPNATITINYIGEATDVAPSAPPLVPY